MMQESVNYARVRRQYNAADVDGDGMLSEEEYKNMEKGEDGLILDDYLRRFESDKEGHKFIRFQDLDWNAHLVKSRGYLYLHIMQLFSGVFSFCGSLLLFRVGDEPDDNFSYVLGVWSALEISLLMAGFSAKYGSKYKKGRVIAPLVLCCVECPMVSVVFLIGALSYVILAAVFQRQADYADEITQEDILNSRIPAMIITGGYIVYIIGYMVVVVVLYTILQYCGCVKKLKFVPLSEQKPATSIVSFSTITSLASKMRS